MRFAPIFGMAVAALAAIPLAAQTTPASGSAPAAAAHYTTGDTDIGTLLDDPASKTILVKYLPDIVKNDQIEQARPMTLKAIQPYASDMITDKVLADIDADLAKLPVKKK